MEMLEVMWASSICKGIGIHHIYSVWLFIYPPASEASREVENLTERKNPHTLVYGINELVCLSVCLLQNISAPLAVWPVFVRPI